MTKQLKCRKCKASVFFEDDNKFCQCEKCNSILEVNKNGITKVYHVRGIKTEDDIPEAVELLNQGYYLKKKTLMPNVPIVETIFFHIFALGILTILIMIVVGLLS